MDLPQYVIFAIAIVVVGVLALRGTCKKER